MNIPDLSNFFSDQNLINLFFKAFSVVFSFLYLGYSIVLYKQTQIMTKTVQTKGSNLILLISLIQIAIGVGLIFFALLIL